MTLPDPEFQPEFYADVPAKRLIAWLIDSLATIVLTLIPIVLTLFIGIFFLPLLYIAVGLAYRTVTISLYGATPGMLLTALKLRRLDGSRPDAMLAFAHSALYSFALSVIVLQIVSVAMMLLSPQKRGLHDQILGTAVLNRAAPD
ncbi:RDD family protein [Roseicitreum antarcticum]|uniref:Uncharacterized membrane protein YckC, RDD family n=1 Tax=Roseicitreum antarcticum TaxID=564137 RepID=A0A1H3C836_9RHOB|nr:RDD family protein [Roseicitreum antarcticum]SDX50256.1 Uncharacterized membrane protein YckC, RDD family [Roseicitreum antarcticum]